jgi:hypothetical protein
MSRPIGVPNLQIPDPPFIFTFGEHINLVLSPKQVEGETKGEFGWAFDVQLEINGKIDEKNNTEMSLEDLEDLETAVKVSVRWTTKMDREKDKLESQLEDLKKKLAFLQR